MGDGKASSSVAIGIDLGTTYSCVAVWRNDRVEIITNDQGNRITPSCVAFNDTQRMIGDAAKNQIAANPTNTVFEMSKTNAQESYQRVQEARARSRAGTGSAKAIISPPPPPRNVGTPSQPIVISSSISSQPPPSARPFPEPEKKKRKTLESGSSEAKADVLAFVRKNIYPHARISMDDVSVRNHLTTLVKESLKAAGVCGKLLDIFEKAPLSSLGMTSRVEELEGRLLMFQEHERELNEEVAKLKEERDNLREKERKLQAQCNMEVGLRKTAQASYQSLFEDLVSVKNDLLNSRKAYTELEDSIADGAEEAWRIFKEQVGVIAPDLDLSPLDPDKVVIDGAIVDPPAPRNPFRVRIEDSGAEDH
ncbi:uncharacterized protein [Arachis hypogaea]|uniref:uncharacterized protein n=1 Tax=Arachis hypogaea TaxID=3818 RepID=UPI003B20B861